MWPFSTYPEFAWNSLEGIYDYIIVGGGTSGCVLANRLSEDPSVSVLVVEQGQVDDSWVSRVPLFSQDFKSGTRTWRHKSVSQHNINDRELDVYAGTVLGGTSRINAMLYTRGMASEYDKWKAEGREGWGFEDVLPLFKMSERYLSGSTTGERGREGAWPVRHHDQFYYKPTEYVFAAAEKLGLPLIYDQNDSSSPAAGCAKAQFTIDEKGHRASTFSSFLPAKLALARKANLTICTRTLVTKLDIKPNGDDSGLKVDGVFVQSVESVAKKGYVGVRKEIILCCGPLANPKVLMLSGIGPKEHLEQHGVPVLKNLPGVGSNLQDHTSVPLVYEVPMDDSLAVIETKSLVFLREFFKYMTRGAGLLLVPIIESMLFVRSDLLNGQSRLIANAEQLDAKNPENIPDIEIMPLAYDGTYTPIDKKRGKYGFLCSNLRPHTRGTVRLASSNPLDQPLVDLNTLADLRDWAVIRTGLRLTLRIAEVMTNEEGYPMKAFDDKVPKSESDEDLDAFIRIWARSTFHYTSTCRMAPEVPSANEEEPGVVDDQLRVHGIKGLRIADSSIFPSIIATHTQAPAVMVAEKCAALLKGIF